MLATEARRVARQWVEEEATSIPGFRGALLHGSAVWLDGDAPVLATSDVDILVLLDDADPGLKLGKLLYHGVLLDVTTLSWEVCKSPESILGNYHLAGSFVSPDIISDPTGGVARLQQRVSREYAKREWVIRRCEDARENALSKVRSLYEGQPLPDQVTSWLFATGVLTHIPLVAGLRNPTVRKRHVAVRDLLRNYGFTDTYDELLKLLGSAKMSRARVELHLEGLAEAFDAASEVIHSPVFFASDLSAAARPIAIDGSREMIATGDHREAMFWIVATWCRCMHVFHDDAPELEAEHLPVFRELLADLGITSFADLQRRTTQTEAFIPDVWDVTERIITANPEIEA